MYLANSRLDLLGLASQSLRIGDCIQLVESRGELYSETCECVWTQSKDRAGLGHRLDIEHQIRSVRVSLTKPPPKKRMVIATCSKSMAVHACPHAVRCSSQTF